MVPSVVHAQNIHTKSEQISKNNNRSRLNT